MNIVQNFIDRQIGIHNRFNYDNFLKRLVNKREESFYAMHSNALDTFVESDSPIFACRFSEAPGFEHILALANEDGRVAIQDTFNKSTAQVLESFPCHSNAVFDLAWMPGTKRFVTVSGDHSACLWDVAYDTPRLVHAFGGHTRSVKTVVFRPNDPAVFATGARDGNILLWDIRASQHLGVTLRPDDQLMNCHFRFTPKTLGSHSKRQRFDNQRAVSITGLVFQNDLTLISCGEHDGNIKMWDLRKNYHIHNREPLPKHSIPYGGTSTRNGYTNLIVDETRMRLYASCMDNVIYCFNISTYNNLPEQKYVGHENGTFYIKTCLSPDNKYLMSGSSDKNAYIWNVKYFKPVVRLIGHDAEVTSPAWCQKGDMKIVTCSDDARHKIWRIGTEIIESNLDYLGFAENVPSTDVSSLPRWGNLDKTPNSVKRKATTPGSYSSKRHKAQENMPTKNTKRRLTDMINAARDDLDPETFEKRLRLDTPQSPDKRSPGHACGTPAKKPRIANAESPGCSSDWVCSPKAGTSFLTPTKNYVRKPCKKLTPKSPRCISSPDAIDDRSPVRVLPETVRIISFSTPTQDLPNFVLDGEAPHLRLMSPPKKKHDTLNWLTVMSLEKKGKTSDTSEKLPLSPKENILTRKNPNTQKTSKPDKKNTGNILKYFNFTNKGK